jgi:hypothetical protein
MMTETSQPDSGATLTCPALAGANPLPFFAALGVLEALDARWKQSPNAPQPRLGWSAVGLRTVARFENGPSSESLIELLLEDRGFWLDSPVLTGAGVFSSPPKDLKVEPHEVRSWYQAVLDTNSARQERLFRALLSEGALDASKGTSAKPTHLHFTAGNQAFLKMVRELGRGLDEDELREAMFGPWTYQAVKPSLSWDTTMPDRQYALRASNPSTEKKPCIPGAEWLGFLGLAAFVVHTQSPSRALTTGCEPGWKVGSMTWPLWSQPLSWSGVRGLLSTFATADSPGRFAKAGSAGDQRGIGRALTAQIHRADQGGYGSFGAPAPVEADGRASPRKKRAITA